MKIILFIIIFVLVFSITLSGSDEEAYRLSEVKERAIAGGITYKIDLFILGEAYPLIKAEKICLFKKKPEIQSKVARSKEALKIKHYFREDVTDEQKQSQLFKNYLNAIDSALDQY